MIVPLAFIAGVSLTAATFLTCSQTTSPGRQGGNINISAGGYVQRNILDYGQKLDAETDASAAIK